MTQKRQMIREKLLWRQAYTHWSATTWRLLIGAVFACLSLSAELGESMRLESRLAMRRGLKCLLQWQQSDGAWEQNWQTTSQAVMAAEMAGMDADWETIKIAKANGGQWLENWLQQELTDDKENAPVKLAVAIRPLLRQGRLKPEAGRAVQQILATGQLSANCQRGLPWLLEAVALLQCSPATMAELKRQVPPMPPTTKSAIVGHDAATALLLGQPAANLAEQVEAAIKEATVSNDFTDLYWLTRAARILQRRPQTRISGWQPFIMVRLLNSQKPDGGWGEMDADQQHRILDTAMALQILVFCLQK